MKAPKWYRTIRVRNRHFNIDQTAGLRANVSRHTEEHPDHSIAFWVCYSCNWVASDG